MDYTRRPGLKIESIGKVKNTEKTQIAIVTPFYNTDEIIYETYNSVISQTYPYFEWIIVDDGSTDDNSIKLLEQLEKKDKRIKVFHKENGGPAVARDYGIQKTSETVKYVFFLDSDDVIDKTLLECLYWTLETNPDASFAFTSVVNFGDREFIWDNYFTVEEEKENNLITVSAMVKKDDLIEVGCFGINEKAMYEDWNLWLKLIRAGKKPVRVSSSLFWYRQSNKGEFSKAKKNHASAMKYIRQTASGIDDDIVEPIQYPRYGELYATIKDYNMILPDYEKDKRKTILYIFPWMVVGGADFFNLDLIKRLDNKKYRSIILTTTPSTNPIRQQFEEYAEVYDMSSFMDRINYINFADYIISSRKVDLIFISNSEYGYYMAPYLKNKYNIPIIDYIHCVDIFDQRKGFARCTKDVKDYIDNTYCCNNATLRELKEDFGVKNAQTIYIGTNEKKFDPSLFNKEQLRDKYKIPKNKIIISFICRLADQKRPLMFAEIEKRVCKKDNRVFFVVAGDGPLMPQVKNAVDDNVKFLGMIKQTEEIYALSDMTLNCSSFEGLALTSYESLSMGVPVVSTDAGGQSELIDNSVGGLVHYNENPTTEIYEEEINNYVTEILRVIDDLQNISNNCRKKIINGFTLDLMAQKFDKIFEKLINDNKKINSKLENKVKKIIDTDDNKQIYELALEAFYESYWKFTNEYYETYFGIYLDGVKSKHYYTYKKLSRFFDRFGARNDAKMPLEFLRNLKKTIHQLIISIKFFLLSILAVFKIIYKVGKKALKKIFN